MPTKPKPTKRKGLDVVGALTRKFGPLPAWGWLLIAAGAIYLYRRHTAASTGASSTSTTDTGSATGGLGDMSGGGDGSGGSAGSGSPSSDQGTGVPIPVAAGGGGGGGGDTNNGGGTGSSPSSAPAGVPAGLTGKRQAAAAIAIPSAQRLGVSPDLISGAKPIPVRTPNFGEVAQAKTEARQAAGEQVAFGGVTSVHTNKKTGVQTTTYANGRVVTQAKGKTAYVSKKGS